MASFADLYGASLPGYGGYGPTELQDASGQIGDVGQRPAMVLIGALILLFLARLAWELAE